jgi:DNA-binding NtrC family response regulator
MNTERILIIDDDDGIRGLLGEFLEMEGYEVKLSPDGERGIDAIHQEKFDLVITDLKMPGIDGIKILQELKRSHPETIGIVLTGYASVESAIQAMKLGAFDYLTKPINLEEFKVCVSKALEFNRIKKENRTLREHLKERYHFKNIIGISDPMQKVFSLMERISRTDSTVLILGETGTGKELVARAIHFNSERQNRPLVTVHCGAIPEALLESELFGYEKGAFTGAIRRKIGHFENANGGTIFLDEIGDMTPGIQIKLLRVLEEQEFYRLGGLIPIKVDVRVIAATNKDLEKEIKKGNFREDLYYRLNIIPIELPPLRERVSDIPFLVDHFIKKFNKLKKQNVEGISEECLSLFKQYSWPGNVRELENIIERLVVLKGTGIIDIGDLPDKIKGLPKGDLFQKINLPDSGIDLNMAVNLFERELILQALNRTNWIKNKAAKLLHLNRTTLVEKMKRKNILQDAS